MKKITFLILSFLMIIACQDTGSINQISAKATATANENHYQQASNSITYESLVKTCQEYLEPLGFPGFNAQITWTDGNANPGIINVHIYPAFQVPGAVNTTIRFGPEHINVYKVRGTKVYLLAGTNKEAAVSKTLLENNDVIGFNAQYKIEINLTDNATITPLRCFKITEDPPK